MKKLIKKVLVKLLGLKVPLEPGSYEATLEDIKVLKSGNASITLSQIKRRQTK